MPRSCIPPPTHWAKRYNRPHPHCPRRRTHSACSAHTPLYPKQNEIQPGIERHDTCQHRHTSLHTHSEGDHTPCSPGHMRLDLVSHMTLSGSRHVHSGSCRVCKYHPCSTPSPCTHGRSCCNVHDATPDPRIPSYRPCRSSHNRIHTYRRTDVLHTACPPRHADNRGPCSCDHSCRSCVHRWSHRRTCRHTRSHSPSHIAIAHIGPEHRASHRHTPHLGSPHSKGHWTDIGRERRRTSGRYSERHTDSHPHPNNSESRR